MDDNVLLDGKCPVCGAGSPEYHEHTPHEHLEPYEAWCEQCNFSYYELCGVIYRGMWQYRLWRWLRGMFLRGDA